MASLSPGPIWCLPGSLGLPAVARASPFTKCFGVVSILPLRGGICSSRHRWETEAQRALFTRPLLTSVPPPHPVRLLSVYIALRPSSVLKSLCPQGWCASRHLAGPPPDPSLSQKMTPSQSVRPLTSPPPIQSSLRVRRSCPGNASRAHRSPLLQPRARPYPVWPRRPQLASPGGPLAAHSPKSGPRASAEAPRTSPAKPAL